MAQLLRFHLYADSSRKVYTQLHPDIEIKTPPKFGYGELVSVGDDGQNPATWPWYVVANITRLRQEKDPTQPGMNHILFEVFLAKEDEWAGFGLPEELEGMEPL